MGEIQISSGSALKLELLLTNGATNFFPQAEVTDNAGIAIAGSPFDLAHNANGNYRASSPPSPANGKYRSVYIVYNEIGHSTLAPFRRSTDDFDVRTDVEDAIWDEARSGHTAGGTFGGAIDDTISSREAESAAASRASITQAEHDATQIQIAALNNIGVPEVQTALTNQGYTTARAPNLDSLDVAVSSRAIEANAVTRAAADIAEHDSTQVQIAGLNNLSIVNVQTALTNQGYTVARASLLDNLDVVISTRASQTSIDNLSPIIADAVWDELLLDHQASGSMGEGLFNAGGGATPALIADAVWDEARSPHSTGGSFGEALQGVLSTARAGALDNLDVSISSRSTQASVDALGVKIGSPVGSLASQNASIKLDTAGIRTDYTTVRAGRLDSIDTTISSRATQASVTAIQNNTRFVGVVPETLLRPQSGTTNYKLNANLFNDVGTPEDPDADTLNIRIEDLSGGIVQATTAMSKTGVGRYEFTFPVANTDPERALRVFFEYLENSVFFQQVRVAEVRDTDSKLDTLLNRLTAPRASNLDSLDAAISSLQTEADAASRAGLAAKDATVAKETTASGIKTKTDQLAFDTGRIVAKSEIVTDKTGYSLSASSEDSIVDKVWDEPNAAHVTAGSTGLNLSNAGGAASPAAIADAVWDELASGHNTSGTMGFLQNLSDDIKMVVDDIKIVVDEISAETDPAAVAAAVWDEAKAGHTSIGSFGESNQGIVSSARAALMDNLSSLDVAVSSRGTSAQSSTILSDVATLLSRLTSGRAANLDNLDVPISSRATQTSVNAIPSLTQIVDGVWDESQAAHVTAGTTGKSLADSGAIANPDAIADAVWDELRAGHAGVGSFGEVLDAFISSRASSAEIDSIKGGGFSGATDTLEQIRNKIDILPTASGDATESKQDTIIASLGSKASQTSVDNVKSVVDAIPQNPLLTNDSRLDFLDVAVSSRVSTTNFDTIKGAGFNPGTDSLEEIRDAINASVDLSPVLVELDAMKGATFDSTDSLEAISDRLSSTKTSADTAATESAAANAGIGSKSSQVSVDALAVNVGNIPTNPALTTDPRLDNLDAQVSTRSTAADIDALKGATYNPLTDSLEEISNKVSAINPGDATKAKQDSIIASLTSKASQSSVNAVQSTVNNIPTNPLLTNDARLDNLDALISSRASSTEIDSVKGAGFATGTDSLKEIRDKLDTGGISVDLNPVLDVLGDIKGTGFSSIADALKPSNDQAIAERSSIKSDTTALLSTGEGV